MPTQPESEHNQTPKRLHRRTRHTKVTPAPLISGGALLIIVVGVLILTLRGCGADPVPTPTPTPTPVVTPTPPPTPTPTPEPTPEPTPVYDFTQPVPQGEPVGDDYFADAVFVGDSRTDGLRLFGGIPETAFIQSSGITVFEVGDQRKGVRIDGEKRSFLEALALKQYGKVYLMLGVNELGYFDDPAFEKEYAGFVDKVRALQPDAVIYLQNLVSINPDKAKANDQPYYITNEQIAIYNDIIAHIATDKQAVLVDVNAALVGEDGILPREGTTDGVHFSKDYYKKWYEYLKCHTVDADLYWAGQTAD